MNAPLFTQVVAAAGVPCLPLPAPGSRPALMLVGDGLDAATPRLAQELAACTAITDACFLVSAVERHADPALARQVRMALAVHGHGPGPAVAVLVPDAGRWLVVGALPAGAQLAPALLAIAENWADDPAALIADAHQLKALPAAMATESAADTRRLDHERLGDLVEAAIMAQADPLVGGFGLDASGAPALPRLPQPALLAFLAQRARRPDAAPQVATALGRAAAALVAGAVHDQLAGGFHHAASDPHWCLPRFEKRLADQAQIAWALLQIDAAGIPGPWRAVAVRTLQWALTALGRADGWCDAGMHAVDARGEGRCYAWSRDELAAVIGEAAAAQVAQRFGVGDELTTLPGMAGFHTLAIREEIDARHARELPAWVRRLEVARSERPQPPRDPRIDAPAHGMLLLALHALREAPGFTVAGQRIAGLLYDHADRSAWRAVGLAAWGITVPFAADDDACDDEDGPAPAAVTAWAHLAQGDPAAASAIIARHHPVIRRAAHACAGLALVDAWLMS